MALCQSSWLCANLDYLWAESLRQPFKENVNTHVSSWPLEIGTLNRSETGTNAIHHSQFLSFSQDKQYFGVSLCKDKGKHKGWKVCLHINQREARLCLSKVVPNPAERCSSPSLWGDKGSFYQICQYQAHNQHTSSLKTNIPTFPVEAIWGQTAKRIVWQQVGGLRLITPNKSVQLTLFSCNASYWPTTWDVWRVQKRW